MLHADIIIGIASIQYYKIYKPWESLDEFSHGLSCIYFTGRSGHRSVLAALSDLSVGVAGLKKLLRWRSQNL